MRPWLLALTLLACTPDPPADAGTDAAADAAADAGADAAADADATADADAAAPPDAATPPPPSVLVFSRTTGYRHDSIADGITALTELAATRGWTLDATEDPTRIEALDDVDVLVFLSPTGDPLDDAQQAALEAWVRAGGGWVGIHAAADCEYDWPFYGELVGAWFARHPAIQPATYVVEDRDHPATAHLDATWMRTDEHYDFRRNPRPDVRVLLTVDESSYSGGGMGADHPVTWAHEVGAGRSFYTALGHTSESYEEPAFRALLGGAIEWAAAR